MTKPVTLHITLKPRKPSKRLKKIGKCIRKFYHAKVTYSGALMWYGAYIILKYAHAWLLS